MLCLSQRCLTCPIVSAAMQLGCRRHLCSSGSQQRYSWINNSNEQLDENDQKKLEFNKRYFGLVREENVLPENLPHGRPGDTHVHSVLSEHKWGGGKSPEALLAEAKALVRAVPNWQVAGWCVQTVTGSLADRRQFWSRSKLAALAEMAAGCAATAVFVNIDRLTTAQRLVLAEKFKKPVYDRYGVVVAIFKEYATSAESRMQVQLAEIPYIRDNLYKGMRPDGFHLAEGNYEYKLRVIRDRERWLRARLAKYKQHWQTLMAKRSQQFHIPVVAVVGYTNAGKTTLINRLTRDARAQGQDRLFATLNVQDYRCVLPNGLQVAYVDTVGFISQLPTALLPSFQSTLNYVQFADVIVHVCDASDSHYSLNRQTVLDTLRQVQVPDSVLQQHTLTVNNKLDLLPREHGHFQPHNDDLNISCQSEGGLDSVVARVAELVCRSCGYKPRRLKVPSQNYAAPLQLLRSLNECVVQQVIPSDDHRHVSIRLLCTDVAWARFTHAFKADRQTSS